MVKDKRVKIIFIYFLIIMLSMFFIGFMSAKRVYASEKTAYDVLIDMGFNGVKDRSDYKYHFIYGYSQGYIRHFYANEPLRIQYYKDLSNYHNLIIVNGYYDLYGTTSKEYHSSGDAYESAWWIKELVSLSGSSYSKEDIIDINYIPDGNLKSKHKVYYVSGDDNTGVIMHDNALSDLGYDSGDVFFFQGDYSAGGTQSPLSPPDNNTKPGLSDDDKSWFSGLFSGITQAINNVKDTIISSVTSAFDAVGQAIINGIKAIFIPDTEFLNEKIDSVKEKFAFIDSIKEAFDSLSNMLSDGNETVPKFTLDLSSVNSKYNYGSSAVALDMTWYSSFKPYVDGIIIAFAYISFIFLVFKRAPEIIKGSGATTTGDNGME